MSDVAESRPVGDAPGSLLRICTAGSVDDGKSTLIGRLLYDSRGVYEDQVRSVQAASRNRTAGPIDFSLFTDGLRAEREQGITIDVAYRYFATARRKFILADTPGHEQYTRNMATGASTAEVAILLVDARHGVREQSRRHARIAQLLGIANYVLAVNKMDLVDFDRGVFDAICDEFAPLVEGAATFHPIPVSALDGDNVITRSARTPWFKGSSLLEHLETVDVERDVTGKPFRFPVQLVVRPDQDFRGYAGQIVSGIVRVGDRLTVWPSQRTAQVTRIVTWDGDIDLAFAPMSVTLVLDQDVDVSRGDVLAAGAMSEGRRFEADIVWMDERPLNPSRPYLLKHATRTVSAEVERPFELNEIGRASVATSRLIVFDAYRANRAMGSFILIDPSTHFTAGAGMIVEPVPEQAAAGSGRRGVAERIALAARDAGSDQEAIEIVRRALEEILG
jgi:sulfate adenylyltransferase large subunit